jgi:hypothetical protein
MVDGCYFHARCWDRNLPIALSPFLDFFDKSLIAKNL